MIREHGQFAEVKILRSLGGEHRVNLFCRMQEPYSGSVQSNKCVWKTEVFRVISYTGSLQSYQDL